MTNVVPMYPEDEFWERVGAAALKRERLLDQAVLDAMGEWRNTHDPWAPIRYIAAKWVTYGTPVGAAKDIRRRFAELSRHA